MSLLNQVIAVEKGVKSRVNSEISALHHESAKTEPYQGHNKVFRKKDEEGEDFAPERKKVKINASDLLKQTAKIFTDLFDVTATKDWGNCSAKADLVVDGTVLVKDAPVTYLLFLEKQITDLRTFVDKMPVLDPNEEWTLDPASNLFRSAMSSTHRTKKVQKPIVLFPATPEHPAQTQLIAEDVIIGWWDTTNFSGALPAPRKATLLERIDKVLRGVKYAREQANSIEVQNVNVGDAVFGYILQ